MAEAVPAIGFSISVQIGEKQSIVAQTHIDNTASLSEINALIDKVQASLDRQKLKVDHADWIKKLAFDTKKLKQIKEDFVRLDQNQSAAWESKGRKGEFKLGPKEEADRRNAISTIERYEQELKLDQESIAECEAKLEVKAHLRVA